MKYARSGLSVHEWCMRNGVTQNQLRYRLSQAYKMSESESGNQVSAKKLAANRRNAQKSTGPRTAEGKAISRLNALKHGIFQRDPAQKDTPLTRVEWAGALVATQFKLDLFSDCWFVFCNKGQDKLKILYWDHNGFWLYYRRLERGRFRWPNARGEKPLLITRRELQWLLDGLTLEQKQAHPAVLARAVA